MKTIEKGINDLDSLTKTYINKHKQSLAKTLFEAANKSNKSAKSFDVKSKKVFPEALDLGTPTSEAFNPDTVVEFRDGKAFQVIDTWNKDRGILPNRVVMGEYYIELTLNQTNYNIKHIYNSNNNNYDHISEHTNIKINSIGHYMILSNRSIFDTSYAKDTYAFRVSPQLISHNYSGADGTKYVFEVDNYLNLFHKENGLYMMLHKTSFPNLAFYLAKQFTNHPDDGSNYYRIYLTKHLLNLPTGFTFNQSYYHSFDKRYEFLNNLNELVPNTYDDVFQLFNRFRKFESFQVKAKTDTSDQNDEEVEEDDDSELYLDEFEETKEPDSYNDTNSRINTALQRKLNSSLSQCDKLQAIILEMTESYNKQSVDYKSLQREKKLLEIKIFENEKENQELLEQTKQEKDNESFQLYKRLAEAFSSKAESLDISMKSIQQKLEKQTLEYEKIRDLNKGLTQQIISEKDRNIKLYENNRQLLNQIEMNQEKLISFDTTLKELELENNKKEKELFSLNEKLTKLYSESDNALENALCDQVEELKEANRELKDEYNDIYKDKKKLEKELKNIRNTLKGLGL
jgi:hypothetical protein